jgi:hypothetical protein
MGYCRHSCGKHSPEITSLVQHTLLPFEEFVAGITDCLDQEENDNKDERKTLMKPNSPTLKTVNPSVV